MPNDADQLRQVAAEFQRMSEAVDDFRQQHFDALTADQRARLEQFVQRLDDIHDQLTGLAIDKTLDALRGDLDRIASVTTQAQQALKHLNTVAEIVKIVSAAAELGQAIATADYGAIPQAIEDIVQALPQKSDKNNTP